MISALVVDDEPRILKSIERLLKACGVVVYGTTSPRAAFEVIKRNPERFDFVLSDYHMPELLGDTLVTKIQNELGDKAPPCIIMTGVRDFLSDSVKDTPRGVTIIEKPIDLSVLVDALQEVHGVDVQHMKEARHG